MAIVDPGEGVARDFLIDPATRELVFVNGNLVFVRGLQAIRQAIDIALRFFRGEYFLDLSVGVPYFDRVLGRGHSEEEIRSVIRGVLLGVEGVASVVKLDVLINKGTRILTVTWSVTTNLGALSGETEISTP